MVHRLELDPAGSTVVAAHIARDGVAHRVRINREVIVSAGAIESPKLLMLSGIGPAAQLAALGIEVRIDLPGVGQNLHDHLAASVSYRATKDVPPPNNTGLEGALFCRSVPSLEHYDLQFSFIHIPTDPPAGLVEGSGFTFFGGALPSDSRGSLTLTSTDPTAHPRIDPRYLTEEADVERLIAAVEIGRDLASAPAFDPWRGAEIAPAGAARSKAELRDYVARTAQTFFHPVGTCKMGVGTRQRGRSAAAGPRHAEPAHRGRLGDPRHPLGEPERHRHHDRLARRHVHPLPEITRNTANEELAQ